MLDYSKDNFEFLQTNLEVLQKTMEEIQQAQACDHRKSDVFMYAFRTLRAINNVSWTLNANVFSNPHGQLITMEVPVYSGEPIHDAYKAIPLPKPIKNTTTAATLTLERSYLIVSRREKSYA